jgi:chemotaxis protein methyltransferase WspC
MSESKIEQLLHKKLGLELSSVGKTAIKSGLHNRMRTLHLDRIEHYITLLESSVQELDELVEEVVIPETWFFRNTHPFVVVTSFVAKQLARKKGSFIKLLSAPCSSGEEAYSMAIALVEAGIAADQFSIHGVDISGRALARAEKAVYRENSFRENDLHLRYKYFQKEGNHFILNAQIRKMVHFRQGNILNEEFMQGLGIFDVLFCRNLLIYLDRQARQRAFAHIDKLLAPDGILFVGHAESGLLDRDLFRSSPYPKAFAFFRAGIENSTSARKPPAHPQKMKSYHSSLLADSYRYSTTSRSKPAHKDERTPHKEKNVEEDALCRARQLADERRHTEATALLKEYLHRDGTSAEAYYLLGMIRVESGDTKDGATLLRKAVYLEPNHVDALFLLSLLAERAGDFTRAKIFEERIQRLKQGTA